MILKLQSECSTEANSFYEPFPIIEHFSEV